MNETLNEIKAAIFWNGSNKKPQTADHAVSAFASCSSSAMSAVSCRSWLAVKILWGAAQQQKKHTKSDLKVFIFFVVGAKCLLLTPFGYWNRLDIRLLVILKHFNKILIFSRLWRLPVSVN